MTSTDERLERYLHDRSTAIDLPHAGVDDITRRARRHRRRRTAACGGAVAALLVGGAAVMIGSAPDGGLTSTADRPAASVVDSSLEWSIVPSRAGIGWGTTALSDGGAVYSLSTAAPTEDQEELAQPRRLYRSDDGTDWSDVALPEGLYASGLATGDGTVYAVGTAAAGGEAVGVEIASSDDGGAEWATDAVPLDLAALADGFPGRVRVVDAEVAVSGGTTVVAVAVTGEVDPAAVLPDGEDPARWYQELGGLVRTGGCEPLEVTPDPAATTTAPADAGGDDGSTTVPPAEAQAGEECRVVAPPAADAAGRPSDADPNGVTDGDGDPVGAGDDRESRSWADLGIDPGHAAIAEGQTHLFATDGEGRLVPVETLAGATYADPARSHLVAADDGFWMVAEEGRPAGDATDRLVWDRALRHSPDGHAWTSTPLELPGHIVDGGVVDGRPVLVTMGGGDGSPGLAVHRVEPGGTVTQVDVAELLDLPDDVGIFASAVGPLGVAVVVNPQHDPTAGLEVVHSSDGVQFSRQPLPEPEPGTKEGVNGITITPDAVKVRLNVRDEADQAGGVPEAQRLFVGTPAG